MRLAATAFAVLLGVAFIAGTLVLTDTLTASAHDVVDDADGEVDAMVRAPQPVELAPGQAGARIDASLADTISALAETDEVAVRITGYAQVVAPDGEPIGDLAQAPALAQNWVHSDALNPYRMASGSPPVADDEIVIDRGTARQGGFEPGDEITVISSSDPQRFTLSGVATFGRADSAAGAGAVLFTDVTAAELFGLPGQADSIVATAADGVDQDALVASITVAVPGAVEVVSGTDLLADQRAHFDEMIRPYEIFMLVFAFVSVFVGAFIINNTFSISVAQRMKDLALLRAIGASRRQVLRSVLIEAVVVGIGAPAVGLVAGVTVAVGLGKLMGGLGIELPDGPLAIEPTSLVAPFAVGLIVTVMSAYLPARRAGRIRPIAALRDVAIERTETSFRRLVAGSLTLTAGMALLLHGLANEQIAVVGLGALILLAGAASLAPVMARPAARIIGAALHLGGLPGELATRNAMRNPKRTARTASALMIGVALITFITVFAQSFRSSFDAALDTDFSGTHVIESRALDGGGGLTTELAEALRATPGVRLVTASRTTAAVVEGKETELFWAYDGDTLPAMFDLGSTKGDITALSVDGLAVSEAEAAERGWSIGDAVPVLLPTGPVELTVRAVYEDETWVGPVFVDTAVFDWYLPDQLDYGVYVDGDDDAVRATADRFHVEVLDRQGFADTVNGEIDQMLGLIYALLALAVVIALFGVANTVALSVHERTRELGLLRAVGMARHQIRRTIRGEAVIVAVYGTATGAGVGIFFAWASVRALAQYGIDDFTLPLARLAAMAVVAGVAGGAAALIPARRAGRLDVLEALAAN